MILVLKIAIHQFSVDPARVNSAFPTRVNLPRRAGTAVNILVHSLLGLTRRDGTYVNFSRALLILAAALLTLAAAVNFLVHSNPVKPLLNRC
jgi:hypothetical protein